MMYPDKNSSSSIPPNQSTPPYSRNPQYPPYPPQTPIRQPVTNGQRRKSRRNRPPSWMAPRRKTLDCLLILIFFVLLAGIVFGAYLLFPFRTNILMFGIDYADPWNSLARSDSIMLTTFLPQRPYVGILSVPRDLWVTLPGYGENRINTAHFFGEATAPGLGPAALIDTINANFGIKFKYFVRFRFEGFKEIIDAIGGVDLVLPEAMAGYEAGKVHLNGNKALAFVRSRYGSDDFFRMEHGQLLVKAAIKQMLNPLKWWRLPLILVALRKSTTTNVPFWLWPRLGFALMRVGAAGIDNHTITREMATPYVTPEGADVLLPDWPSIHQVVNDMFRN